MRSYLFDVDVLKQDLKPLHFRVRDEKNVRLERKEPKFIVREPEKPGEAVNHHFSKSLVSSQNAACVILQLVLILCLHYNHLVIIT